MRKVVILAQTEEGIEKAWDLIMDIENIFKLAKFVRKVSIKGPIKEGIEFYDVTGILWIPIPIKHKIIRIKKNEKFAMEADLPLKSGKMFQTLSVKDMGKVREIEMEIKYNIDFPVFDIIFSPILQYRLKQMITETFRNIESYINNQEGVMKTRFIAIIEK